MIFESFSSGSHANAYAVDDGKTKVLIEAGISADRLRHFVDLSNVAGCLLTHEHKDHSKYAYSLQKSGIDVYGTYGTLEGIPGHRKREIGINGFFTVGSWSVYSFDVEHDASQPCGYMLYSMHTKERLLFVTDAMRIKYKFGNITHLAIEANHCEQMLGGVENTEHFRRVYGSHLSVQAAMSAIRNNIELGRLETVVLLHLSDQNSDEALFQRRVQGAVNRPVYVCPRDDYMKIGF